MILAVAALQPGEREILSVCLHLLRQDWIESFADNRVVRVEAEDT
jgi:hypothetical protein